MSSKDFFLVICFVVKKIRVRDGFFFFESFMKDGLKDWMKYFTLDPLYWEIENSFFFLAIYSFFGGWIRQKEEKKVEEGNFGRRK